MRASRIDDGNQGGCSHGCKAFLNRLPHIRLLYSEAKSLAGCVGGGESSEPIGFHYPQGATKWEEPKSLRSIVMNRDFFLWS